MLERLANRNQFKQPANEEWTNNNWSQQSLTKI